MSYDDWKSEAPCPGCGHGESLCDCVAPVNEESPRERLDYLLAAEANNLSALRALFGVRHRFALGRAIVRAQIRYYAASIRAIRQSQEALRPFYQ